MESKTVIITGGNRGIGFDITRAFVNNGYKVIVGARKKTQMLDDLNEEVIFVEMDVRNESDHKMIVQKAMEITGRLDVFINNAGYSEWRPIEEIDQEFLSDIINTNLVGAFWGCKAALKVMKQGSSIINISSIASKRGSSTHACA